MTQNRPIHNCNNCNIYNICHAANVNAAATAATSDFYLELTAKSQTSL
jgi:hypothetical protein